MGDLVRSPLAVDLIIAAVVAQGILLSLYALRTGRGIRPASLVATLAAGGFLLIALRTVLAEAWWGWTGLALLASLIAHVLDLRLRWR
ncbi:hypothetical protein [Elioraea sp.]|uniref:hypothetical protein n=1 Tax=Elioraea sp. TaxID=2185103 RepID=UPI0025B8C79C|nr:hypothetical protein [Elioraea sp.]